MVTVGEFVNKVQGARAFRFRGQKTARPMNMFYAKYRRSPFWNAVLDSAELEVERREDSGLWYDRVVCVLTLRSADLEADLLGELAREEGLDNGQEV